MNLNTLTVLGIETSCDETAASVVRGLPPGPGVILSNIVFRQNEAHAPYGGVVPEIASRAHVQRVDGVIGLALVVAKACVVGGEAVTASGGRGVMGVRMVVFT